jgi:hypothetical protein
MQAETQAMPVRYRRQAERAHHRRRMTQAMPVHRRQQAARMISKLTRSFH